MVEEKSSSKKGNLLSELQEDEFDFEGRAKPKPKPAGPFAIDTGSDKKPGSEQTQNVKEPPKSVPKDMSFKSNPFSFSGPEIDLLGKDTTSPQRSTSGGSHQNLPNLLDLNLLGGPAKVVMAKPSAQTEATKQKPTETVAPVSKQVSGPQVSLMKVHSN